MAYFEKTKVVDENGVVITPAHEGGVLARILQMLMAPLGYDKSIQRHRNSVLLETGANTIGAVNIAASQTLATVTTVTTCSTVTTLSNMDGVQGRIMAYGANSSAWADCHRSRIT